MKILVRYNHVGYAPSAAKIFFVNPKELESENNLVNEFHFKVVDVAQVSVFNGQLKNFKDCDYTGETLWLGDFTPVNVSGKYKLQILKNSDLVFETAFFEISEDWIYNQLKANIKSFYFQRSGVELTEKFAGLWARPAAHLDNCIKFHPSMNRAGTWDAHGGWYDAGDYGKYIVNGGISVATLLLAAEIGDSCNKNFKCGFDFINNGGTFDLPYSLKDEIRFELEFFFKMQDEDGGVFFKVTPEHWDGFISPKDSDLLQKRMILGKSTTSTLNFAGVMAAASRVYKQDNLFSEKCLKAAERAYRWAVENDFVDYPHNTEGSGGYGDENASDEFFWARAMLYRELKSEELKNLLLEDIEKNPPKLGLDWRDTQNLGWIALALQNFDSELNIKARKTLEAVALEIIQLQQKNAYQISVQKFIWGSNGDIANHGLTLAIVRLWKPELNGFLLEYWIQELINFIYGRNPVDVSFVTGSAWSSPKYPHHRLSHSDGVKEPMPGFVVGGINADRQDLHRSPHYPGCEPGFSYTDERCSFASNEVAINWSAPLTAVLALLSM